MLMAVGGSADLHPQGKGSGRLNTTESEHVSTICVYAKVSEGKEASICPARHGQARWKQVSLHLVL